MYVFIINPADYSAHLIVTPFFLRRVAYKCRRQLVYRPQAPPPKSHDSGQLIITPTGIAPEPFWRSGFYGSPDIFFQEENTMKTYIALRKEVVQAGRVELPRHFCHEHLKLARLPIPPRLHLGNKKPARKVRPSSRSLLVYIVATYLLPFNAFYCFLLLFTAIFTMCGSFFDKCDAYPRSFQD